jgi:hypothetical protein
MNMETNLQRVNTGLACIVVGAALMTSISLGRAWVQLPSDKPHEFIEAQETLIKSGMIALGVGIGAVKGTIYGAFGWRNNWHGY